MPCPGEGPCSVYDLDLGCCLVSGALPDTCLNDGTPIPQTIIDNSVLAASQMLWALTGRRFACCTVDLRPCRRRCTDECCLPSFCGGAYGLGGGCWGSSPWIPVLLPDGQWTNVSCGCQDACSCSFEQLCKVALPYPTCSVDEVIIDGVVVDPATYRVDEFRWLVREGSDCWPTCNNLTLPPTEVGTWQVTLTYGWPVPQLVLAAAAEFACELIKDCVGRPCKLPRNVTAVTRQGVTEVFPELSGFLQQGYTGLYLTDLAIRTYNPNKLMQRPLVYSPDFVRTMRRTTWQSGDPIGCD